MEDNKDFIHIAKEFLEKVTLELDPHTSQKGVIENEGNEVYLLTPSHIQFAVYGRGPGKRPPLDPILKWVKREKILFDGLSEKGTAFVIQKGIAKNGTKGFKRNAPNALEEAIAKHLTDYNNQLAEGIAVEINDQVQEVYKTVFPERVEFKI